MRKLTTPEVARMTTTQGESFNDQVTLYGYTQSQDSLGQFTDNYDSGSLIDCGLLTQAQYLNERGQVVTIDADAILRVATTQTVNLKDKVIGRGVTYYVDGVQPGRHVHIVALKEIRI